jgi:small subunit ribosomal protein S21
MPGRYPRSGCTTWKPTAVRKRKNAAAVKRHLKKLQRENRKMQRLY